MPTSSAIDLAVLTLSPVKRTTLRPMVCNARTATGASGFIVSAIEMAPSKMPEGVNYDLKTFISGGGSLTINFN